MFDANFQVTMLDRASDPMNQLGSSVSAAEQRLKSLGESGERAFQRIAGSATSTIGAAFHGVNSILDTVIGKITSLPSLFLAAAGGAGMLGQVVKGLQLGTEFEAWSANFQAMTGSLYRARDIMATIRQEERTTPFTLQQLTQSHMTQMSMGVGGIPGLNRAAQFLAAANPSGGGLEQTTQVLSRIAAGEEGGMAARMLRPWGLDLRHLRGLETNEQGRALHPEEVLPALMREIERRYGGGGRPGQDVLSLRMNTVQGMMTNLSSSFDIARIEATSGLLDRLREKLKAFLDYLATPRGAAALERVEHFISGTLVSAFDKVYKVAERFWNIIQDPKGGTGAAFKDLAHTLAGGLAEGFKAAAPIVAHALVDTAKAVIAGLWEEGVTGRIILGLMALKVWIAGANIFGPLLTQLFALDNAVMTSVLGRGLGGGAPQAVSGFGERAKAVGSKAMNIAGPTAAAATASFLLASDEDKAKFFDWIREDVNPSWMPDPLTKYVTGKGSGEESEATRGERLDSALAAVRARAKAKQDKKDEDEKARSMIMGSARSDIEGGIAKFQEYDAQKQDMAAAQQSFGLSAQETLFGFRKRFAKGPEEELAINEEEEKRVKKRLEEAHTEAHFMAMGPVRTLQDQIALRKELLALELKGLEIKSEEARQNREAIRGSALSTVLAPESTRRRTFELMAQIKQAGDLSDPTKQRMFIEEGLSPSQRELLGSSQLAQVQFRRQGGRRGSEALQEREAAEYGIDLTSQADLAGVREGAEKITKGQMDLVGQDVQKGTNRLTDMQNAVAQGVKAAFGEMKLQINPIDLRHLFEVSLSGDESKMKPIMNSILGALQGQVTQAVVDYFKTKQKAAQAAQNEAWQAGKRG